MTIKEKIQVILKEKNFSAVHMEQELGFAKGYISKLDKASPSSDNIVKIANYLGVSTDFLLKDSETISTDVDLSSFPDQDMVQISDEAKQFALAYDQAPDDVKKMIQTMLKYSKPAP